MLYMVRQTDSIGLFLGSWKCSDAFIHWQNACFQDQSSGQFSGRGFHMKEMRLWTPERESGLFMVISAFFVGAEAAGQRGCVEEGL